MADGGRGLPRKEDEEKEEEAAAETCEEDASTLDAAVQKDVAPASDGQYYLCSTCQTILPRVNDVIKHDKKHTPKSPYVCKFCRCTYKSKASLVRHEKTHERQKEYACTQSDQTVTQKDHPDNHLEKCSKFGMEFSRKTDLTQHRERCDAARGGEAEREADSEALPGRATKQPGPPEALPDSTMGPSGLPNVQVSPVATELTTLRKTVESQLIVSLGTLLLGIRQDIQALRLDQLESRQRDSAREGTHQDKPGEGGSGSGS